jgi:hypothetical protein
MAWSVVDAGGGGYTIWDIGGVASSDLWAVNDGGQILHYDGQSWTFVAGGNLPGLLTVFARTATEVYVGGQSQQLYLLDGVAGTMQQLYLGAYTAILSVWGTSTQQLWAATDGTDSVQTWDGVQFEGTSTRGVPDKRFNHVWGTSQSNVWAVGAAGTIVHWDGAAWTVANTPITSDLTWVSGTGPQDVWAIGPYSILHWNGTAWQVVPGGDNAGLNAIWPASSSEVWAVGARGQILHGSPAGFTPVSSGTSKFLYTVWGTSPADVWAGGQDGVLVHYGPAAAGGDAGAPPTDDAAACLPQGSSCLHATAECCYPFVCGLIAAGIGACM